MSRVLKIGGLIIGLLILNLIVHWLDIRFDLTSDKKYSLSEQSKELISDLEDPIEITVFLDGDIPIQFKKYRSFIDQLLRNLRSQSSSIRLTYIDPSEGSAEERQDLQRYFRSYGVNPISRRVSTKDELNQSVLYPYLSVSDRQRTIFIDLLGDKKPGQSEQDAISQSEIGLEQKLNQAIRDLKINSNGLVGVMGDSKELIAAGLNNANGKLGNYFFIPMEPNIAMGNIDTLQGLMVSNHKFEIDRTIQLVADQALMRSIPVIWFIDKYNISIDSIGEYGQYPASPRQLAIEDQLFKYGSKTEPYLLQDLRCSQIPQVVGIEGGQSKTIFIDYPHHPVLLPNNAVHPMSQVEVISFFATTVSPLEAKPGLRSVPLLTSSVRSKYTQDLNILTFDMLRIEPDVASFSGPERDIAIMVEGPQESYFYNRLSLSDAEFFSSTNAEFIDGVDRAKQIVVGDLQIVLPKLSTDGSLFPVGYNSWERKLYSGNLLWLAESLELLLHGNQYLGNTKSLNAARIIDRRAFDDRKYYYYFLMIGLPILLSLVLTILWNWYRRRKYA